MPRKYTIGDAIQIAKARGAKKPRSSRVEGQRILDELVAEKPADPDAEAGKFDDEALDECRKVMQTAPTSATETSLSDSAGSDFKQNVPKRLSTSLSTILAEPLILLGCLKPQSLNVQVDASPNLCTNIHDEYEKI